jgi:hypothetical protein
VEKQKNKIKPKQTKTKPAKKGGPILHSGEISRLEVRLMNIVDESI